jgi:hypothetical protein
VKACTHAKQNKTQLEDIRNKLSDIEKLQKKENEKYINFQRETKKNIILKIKQTKRTRQKRKEEEQNLATQKKLLFLIAMVNRQIKIKQLLSSYLNELAFI